jgi:hypothetical protein
MGRSHRGADVQVAGLRGRGDGPVVLPAQGVRGRRRGSCKARAGSVPGCHSRHCSCRVVAQETGITQWEKPPELQTTPGAGATTTTAVVVASSGGVRGGAAAPPLPQSPPSPAPPSPSSRTTPSISQATKEGSRRALMKFASQQKASTATSAPATTAAPATAVPTSHAQRRKSSSDPTAIAEEAVKGGDGGAVVTKVNPMLSSDTFSGTVRQLTALNKLKQGSGSNVKATEGGFSLDNCRVRVRVLRDRQR